MNEKGFTLIELMILIVIAGLVTAICIPIFKDKDSYRDGSYKKQQVQKSVQRYQTGDTVVLKVSPTAKCVVSKVGCNKTCLQRIRCVNDEGVVFTLENVDIEELQ